MYYLPNDLKGWLNSARTRDNTQYRGNPNDPHPVLAECEDADESERHWTSLEVTRAGTAQTSRPSITTHGPVGRVALAFTDIQNSTVLWEHYRHKFKPLLDLHNVIMRRALAKHGGYEVKTEGDAFMIAFAEPIHAARFACAVQLELLDAEWPAYLLEDAETRHLRWV